MHRDFIGIGALAALGNLSAALGRLGDAAKSAGHVLSAPVLAAIPTIRSGGGGKVRHGWSKGHHSVHRKACSARRKAKAKARRRRMRRAA